MFVLFVRTARVRYVCKNACAHASDVVSSLKNFKCVAKHTLRVSYATSAHVEHTRGVLK